MRKSKKIFPRVRQKLLRTFKKKQTPPVRYLGRPKELFGIGSSGKVSIAYLGNGADSNSYQEIMDQRHLDGKAYSGIGGFYNECAVIYIPIRPDGIIDIPVIEAFQHPSADASFAGFTLRKKESGNWMWYLDDDSWSCEGSSAEKKRFFENDYLPDFNSDGKAVVYVLTAEWVNDSGDSMNCGYLMFQNKMMAHALGGMNGKKYLNTLAALEHNIQNGFHYFETDLTLTADDRLMVCHGWTEADCKRFGIPYDPAYKHMSYDMVRGLRIHGSPISNAREFYNYIRNLPEQYCFEMDFHNDTEERLQKVIQCLVQDFNYDKKMFQRLLIQIYTHQMLKVFDSAYPFEVYQYCLPHDTNRLHHILNYCLDYGICALSIRATDATEENIREIKFAGLNILVFTISQDLTYAKTILDRGADTICTNFITEDAIRSHTATMKEQPYYIGFPKSALRDPSGLDLAFNGETDSTGLVYMKVTNDSANISVPDLIDPDPVPEKRFLGWGLRRQLDGANPWYCRDHRFRTTPKLKPETDQDILFFNSGDQLPVLEVKESEKLRLAARRVKKNSMNSTQK